MTYTCKKCGQTKPAPEMLTRQGKVMQTCVACYAAAVAAGRGNAKGGGRTVSSKTKLDKAVAAVTKGKPMRCASLARSCGSCSRRSRRGRRSVTIEAYPLTWPCMQSRVRGFSSVAERARYKLQRVSR